MKRSCLAALLVLGLAFVVSASAEEQQLTDLTLLVGKWKGWSKTSQSTNIPIEMDVQADGAYKMTAYLRQGAQTFTGTFFLEGGKLRVKTSDGVLGSYVLSVDNGKRILKGGRDNAIAVNELEWVK